MVDAGSSVQHGFSSAASAAANVPLGGDAIAGALRSVGSSTGGEVATIGRTGEQSAHHLAVVLGLLMWALPSALLLALVLPRRIREARQLRQARRALREPGLEERRRLLAVRAVLTLPDEALFRHSADPGGDLLAGRYQTWPPPNSKQWESSARDCVSGLWPRRAQAGGYAAAWLSRARLAGAGSAGGSRDPLRAAFAAPSDRLLDSHYRAFTSGRWRCGPPRGSPRRSSDEASRGLEEPAV